MSLLSCKTYQHSSLDGAFDDVPVGSHQLMAGSRYVLRASLKRLFETITLVQQFNEGRTHVATVNRINIGDFQPDSGGISVSAVFDISIDGTGQETRFGVTGTGNVSFQGQATITLRLTHAGDRIQIARTSLNWSRPLKEHINSIETNAILARGFARKKALEALRAKIPSLKLEIEQKFEKAVDAGLRTESDKFAQMFREIAAAMNDLPGAVPRIHSEKGAAFFEHLLSAKIGSSQSPPPVAPAVIDTGFSFREDLFEHLINRSVAGKKLTFEELRLELCKSFSNFYYTMCASEKGEQRADIRLKFADREPFAVDFRDNQIRIELRAQIEASQELLVLAEGAAKAVHSLSAGLKLQDSAGTSVSTAESASEVIATHLTPEVRITLTYALKNREFLRSYESVELGHSDVDEGWFTGTDFYRTILASVLKISMHRALPSYIAVPALPAYLSGDPRVQQKGGAFVVMQPEHFGATNGWIFSYFSYCEPASTQVALGIMMQSVVDQGGTNRIKVTGLHPGSPATRARVIGAKKGFAENDPQVEADMLPPAGLRVGDIIYTIDDSQLAVENPYAMSAFVAGRSLIPERSILKLQVGRRITLKDLESAKSYVFYMNLDYEVELQKVCQKAN